MPHHAGVVQYPALLASFSHFFPYICITDMYTINIDPDFFQNYERRFAKYLPILIYTHLWKKDYRTPTCYLVVNVWPRIFYSGVLFLIHIFKYSFDHSDRYCIITLNIAWQLNNVFHLYIHNHTHLQPSEIGGLYFWIDCITLLRFVYVHFGLVSIRKK